MVRWPWLLVATGCSFEGRGNAGAVDAAEVPGEVALLDAPVDTTAPPPSFRLRVEALIDGESHLHIKGTTVHWRHFIYAAPGRWDSDAAAPWTKEPIKLNGVEWSPSWPDQPTPENRICTAYPCDGVESSTTEIPVGVPRVPSTATWTGVRVRRDQGIVQQPSAANDWELVVLISDYMVGGSDQYIVDIDVTID